MLRTALLRSTRSIAAQRAFSTTRLAMAEGDTGGVRAGGARAQDAFSRRESASEEMFIREQEKAKLLELKEKLAKQRQHIDELAKNIDEYVKSSGGEHN